MAIPQINAIEDFLKSITLQPPIYKDDFNKIEVVPQRTIGNSTNFGRSQSIQLWFNKNATISVESILHRIQEELKLHYHFASADLAKIFLSLVGISSKIDGKFQTEILNKLFSLICKAGVNQYHIMPYPHHPSVKPFKINGYFVGQLDRDKLIYRCEVSIRRSTPF